MGKKSLEPRINLEARYLCEELERSRGSPQYIQLTLNKATANVISQLVYGRRYDYHDEEYDRLIAATFAALTTVSTADPAVIFPFLMKTPLYKKLQQNRMILKNFTMSQLYSHQNTFQKENIRDITDAFLADNISEVYNIEEFCRIVMDYFAAGTETTSTFLSWTILYLAIHPNVQKKVRMHRNFLLPTGWVNLREIPHLIILHSPEQICQIYTHILMCSLQSSPQANPPPWPGAWWCAL